MGDIDGDGRSDLLVGDIGDQIYELQDNGNVIKGIAYVPGDVVAWSTRFVQEIWRKSGSSDDLFYGWGVRNFGFDLNRDRKTEFVRYSPFTTESYELNPTTMVLEETGLLGNFSILSGRNGEDLQRLVDRRGQSEQRFARSLEIIGDITRDGQPEIGVVRAGSGAYSAARAETFTVGSQFTIGNSCHNLMSSNYGSPVGIELSGYADLVNRELHLEGYTKPNSYIPLMWSDQPQTDFARTGTACPYWLSNPRSLATPRSDSSGFWQLDIAMPANFGSLGHRYIIQALDTFIGYRSNGWLFVVGRD